MNKIIDPMIVMFKLALVQKRHGIAWSDIFLFLDNFLELYIFPMHLVRIDTVSL